MHHMVGEIARWELHKNITCYSEQILEATPHKKTVVWPLTSHLKKTSKKNEQGKQDTVEEARKNV